MHPEPESYGGKCSHRTSCWARLSGLNGQQYHKTDIDRSFISCLQTVVSMFHFSCVCFLFPLSLFHSLFHMRTDSIKVVNDLMQLNTCIGMCLLVQCTCIDTLLLTRPYHFRMFLFSNFVLILSRWFSLVREMEMEKLNDPTVQDHSIPYLFLCLFLFPHQILDPHTALVTLTFSMSTPNI